MNSSCSSGSNSSNNSRFHHGSKPNFDVVKTADVSDVTTRGWDVRMLLVEGEVLLLFQLLFQACVTAYEYMSMSILLYNVCVYMCVSMCEFRVY